jgi:hypothetical protein
VIRRNCCSRVTIASMHLLRCSGISPDR